MNPSANLSIEASCELLALRLRSSSYPEDKIVTLKELLSLSFASPLAVGSICLHDIILSINDIGCYREHYEVINNIMNTSLKKEFIEMVFSRPDCTETILSLSTPDFNVYCLIFISPFFLSVFSTHRRCNEILRKLIKEGYVGTIVEMIKHSETLKESLVAAGIVDFVFRKISEGFKRGNDSYRNEEERRRGENRKRESEKYENLFLKIVKNSLSVQKYVFEMKMLLFDPVMTLKNSSNSKLFSNSPPANPRGPAGLSDWAKRRLDFLLDFHSLLLNPKNPEIKNIQKKLYFDKLVEQAMKSNRYKYPYFLGRNNDENLRRMYLDLDVRELIKSAESDKYSGRFLNICIPLLPEEDLVNATTYKSSLMLLECGKEVSLQSKVMDDLKGGNITEDCLLYLIFTYENINEVKKYIKLENLEGMKYKLGLFLMLQHKEDIKARLQAVEVTDDKSRLIEEKVPVAETALTSVTSPAEIASVAEAPTSTSQACTAYALPSDPEIVDLLKEMRRELYERECINEYYKEELLFAIGEFIRERIERREYRPMKKERRVEPEKIEEASESTISSLTKKGMKTLTNAFEIFGRKSDDKKTYDL